MNVQRMRRVAIVLSMILGSAGPAPVLAQNGTGRAILVPSQPGDYKFSDYDQGKLQKTYLDEIFKRSEADKKYFQSTVDEIRVGFSRLLSDTVYGVGEYRAATRPNTAAQVIQPGGLRWMSSTAQAGNYFSAGDFMLAVNRYYEAKQILQTQIVALSAMAEKGTLPSQTIEADGAGLHQVNRYGDVDFSAIKDHFTGELDKIDAFLNNLPFRLILANAKPVLVASGQSNSLTLPEGGTLLSEEELANLQQQITDAQRWADPDQRDDVDAFTRQIKVTVQQFIETYGSSERWRSLSAADQKQRAEDWQELARAFFLRSYLRTMYKMPIGALAIDYSKLPFGLEKFTGRTKDILVFRSEILWNEETFIRGEQDYRNALLRAEERAQKLGAGDLSWEDATKILDGDLTFMVKGRNLMTWLSGNRNLAEAARQMVRLLAADFYEERLIQRVTGPAEMLSRFRARYMATDEDRKFYQELAKVSDPANLSRGGNFNPTSVLGRFRVVALHMRSKRIERKNAEVLQATLDAALGGSRFTREIEADQNSIFGQPGER